MHENVYEVQKKRCFSKKLEKIREAPNYIVVHTKKTTFAKWF
jgi:hypothetical protein